MTSGRPGCGVWGARNLFTSCSEAPGRVMCLQLADIVWYHSARPAWGRLFPPFLFSSYKEWKLCFIESEAEYILHLKYVSLQPPAQDSPGLLLQRPALGGRVAPQVLTFCCCDAWIQLCLDREWGARPGREAGHGPAQWRAGL